MGGSSSKSSGPPPTVYRVVDQRAQLINNAASRLGLNRSLVNVAVTGQRGQGKSSFINAMRGIGDADTGAAAVGELETTMVPTKYPHPNSVRLVWWDLPGAGTAQHPISNYIDNKGVLAFTCLIVLCGQALTENDLYIAKEASNAGIKIIVVRNMTNQALTARVRRTPNTDKTEVKNSLVAEIKADLDRNLKTVGLSGIPLYVIDSWAMSDSLLTKFEEDLLLANIVNM